MRAILNTYELNKSDTKHTDLYALIEITATQAQIYLQLMKTIPEPKQGQQEMLNHIKLACHTLNAYEDPDLALPCAIWESETNSDFFIIHENFEEEVATHSKSVILYADHLVYGFIDNLNREIETAAVSTTDLENIVKEAGDVSQ